ncbi:PSD1 and planctomycete cytochrome C domain-containing protein [Tautonia rosea]|uniref:PSD1 and planctomycete cytochrome C domain-containing protein n=1 Tax=Tautonia rosea TaxID=2728037 RepID=UPI001F326E92|nr:PSD1 and planctomycete cytochrome C domain-containing protein [Tautonia rosea]
MLNRTASVLMVSAALVCGRGGLEAQAQTPDAASETFFEVKIRPVLAESCVTCHGEVKQNGGLRLDSRQAMLDGGVSGPAIEPGAPEESLLTFAISHEDELLKMPPDEPLSREARDDFAAWIAAGAPWPEAAARAPIEGKTHWAFGPLRPIEPPIDPTGWATEPIDQLIAAKQREAGVYPVDRADRRALIRRATFDLIGLPPEPDRVEAFVNDERPDAYDRLIEELLASPHYGERWGRYWLDLARYADTAGDNSDYPIREAYLYRDYVIDAFNADIPYDRFLHEQLAGDILALEGPEDDYARQVIATGFIAQSKRFGTRKLEDIHQIIEDSLHTTGQVVLGLSMRCARCHDHKFDPISANDYYALYGFFAGAKYPFAGAEEVRRPSEFAPLVPPSRLSEFESQYNETFTRLKAELSSTEAEATEAIGDAGFAAAVEQFVGLPDRIERAEVELSRTTRSQNRRINGVKTELKQLEEAGPEALAPKAYAVRDGEPTDAKFQKGGDPRNLGEVVPRGVLRVLDPSGTIDLPETGSGRLALAKWLTDGPPRDLVARVMVNRLWQHHFGKPIVATPSDFGLRGTPPTHPDLLEWLASDFIASGWSIKEMHRRIMRSETYRLASTRDANNEAIDTGNAWYWRFDRRPLDAEALRDGLLALGGNLKTDRPGPHPFPDVNTWTFTAHHQFKALYPSEHRSVYLMVQRLHPHPYLSLFNGPDAGATTAMRDSSTVSLQALYLLNNTFVHDQAERFADRLVSNLADHDTRLQHAYLLAFGRRPTDDERDRAETFLAQYQASLVAEGCADDRCESEAWSALARAMFASNEFFHVD